MLRSLKIVIAAALMLAVSAPALAADKVVDAAKAFPYLAAYLKLPAAERGHFVLTYAWRLDGEPLKAPVWLVDGAQRTPLVVRPADGKVERLPDLAELEHSKIEFGLDAASKISTTLGIEPAIPPAADLDAHELAAAIAQGAIGARKAAGIMAIAMPKLSNVGFVGVASGEIEFADGHRAPLPLLKGVPTYTPADQPNAKRIRLPAVPRKLDIG